LSLTMDRPGLEKIRGPRFGDNDAFP
jgi:hypothetical protein